MEYIPNSPYGFLQEIYRNDPWKMLVGCIFLNQTTRKQVDNVREEFFEKYPTAKEAAKADLTEMAVIIKPLGFYNRRSNTIKKFSHEFLTEDWSEPLQLYGIGRYGQASWQIFQHYNLDVETTDGPLNKYLSWAREYIKRNKTTLSERISKDL
tara:strand:+ start:116 stop:574 length:459 start_codon:yes stop_codon:yes gene_type:complete